MNKCLFSEKPASDGSNKQASKQFPYVDKDMR